MRCTVLIVMLLCALPALAQDGELAGPIWGEGPEENGTGGSKDAGASVETAQEVASPLAGAGGSTLTRISGRTASTALVQTDLVDIYEISISTPANFSAKTEGSTFDTAIFLFRKTLDNNGFTLGVPVVMNDDVSDVAEWSQIGGSTGAITGLAAGTYFLAIAPSGSVPMACRGEPSFAPLFTYTPGSKIVTYPSVSQASWPLCEWVNTGAGGDYQIDITGAVVTRTATCDSSIVLGNGIFNFGNVGTSSDVEALRIGLGSICGLGNVWLSSPSWFRLAPCDGTVTVQVCPTLASAEYSLLVYRGSCGELEPVACADFISCSAGGLGGSATFTATAGEQYLVAFGPITNLPPGGVTTSAGKITIQCTPYPPSCGEGTAGSCFSPQAGPFCDSESCCPAVCAADPFCCNVQWDNFCVQGAYAICAPPPACPPNQPDLDGNGIIDGADLAILLSQWGT
ncbi:MAG: hypothetical protein RLZZ217_2038 [Planctomycetota bacterium]|jgi:hypothetical protein